MTTTVVSWNIAKWHEPWRELVEMGADVALLQEAGMPPADVPDSVDTGPREHWDSHVWNSEWWKGRWPSLYDRWAKVVKLSDRVEVEWFKQVSPISLPAEDEIPVSGIGTIAAARVTSRDGSEPFIVVSMYAKWAKPHPSVPTPWWAGYSDASAHRIISDLSVFIGNTDPGTHRILAAGRPEHHLRRPRQRSAVADRARSERLRQDGRAGHGVPRPPVPQRQAGESQAERLAARDCERSDLPRPTPVQRDGLNPTRLRHRLARLPQQRHGACHELGRRVGSQRPLPPADRGLRLIRLHRVWFCYSEFADLIGQKHVRDGDVWSLATGIDGDASLGRV